ncbi:PQQ-binding-like beta-propeller repeat protein [Saccharibacillus sacchari]|uniref:outer membrane protein assembly factor BamB family protein n=1 Tax=Saccharibacillus sacchari TaxID=456493 RepID=UPI0004B05E28|nr:PQQ-binding-like beta-propeller repeat protein [Saccharibacillus sacchari]
MIPFKRSSAILISAGLLFSLAPISAAAPATSYVNPIIHSSESETISELKPVWSVNTFTSNPGISAVISGNLVVYPAKNNLEAANAATGKKVWTAAFIPASELITGNGTLYFVDSKGMLVGLNAKTGKALWKTKTGFAAQTDGFTAKLVNGTLYIGGPRELQAYNPATGKRLWKQSTESEYGGPSVQGVYDGVLVTSAVVSGALTVDFYNGYDPKTGKELWVLGGSHGPVLHYQKGHIYMREQSLTGNMDHAAILDKVNVKTGKTTATYKYVEVEDGLYQSAQQIVIDQENVYIAMPRYEKGRLEGFSSALYRFKLDQQPDNTQPALYEDRGDFLAGPYLNRFFVQKGLELQSVPINGKMSQSYAMSDNPVSRLDLKGNGAYVGLSDGQLYLIDIASGKTLGVVRAGGRTYGETLLAGNMAIVQAENKLIVIKRPAALTK